MSEGTGGLLASSSGLPRIAMVSTHGYVAAMPPLGAADTGGQVVYVLELSKKLAQLGYEVDVWTRRFEDQAEIEPVGDRVRIVRAACGGPEFVPKEHLYERLPEWADNALRIVSRHGIEYQFVNSHYWDGGVAGMALAEVLGVPHVHTPHSLGRWKERQMLADFPEDAASLDKAFNFRTRIEHESRLFSAADLVIATTPVQTDMLRREYEVPLEKLKMIPPGYDDTRFFPVGKASRDLLRQRFGFEGKVVLSLGRLATNKGYDLLLRAFAEVVKREPEAHLHLAVGGQRLDAEEERLLSELRQTVNELGIEGSVKFAGYVNEDDLADLYRAADVFVLSSRYEPFGMTAVEAMASGTPTVVTTHGGLFRVLRFGIDGLFADTFDPSDLGITLLKPLRHPKLAERLSRNGAQVARKLFTWTGVAQQLIAVVEDRSGRLSLSDIEPTDDWFGPEDYN